MPRKFFSSDPHLGHEGIAKWRGFESAAAHDEHLIGRWNAVVEPDDEVTVLGDVALGVIAESLPKVARLNGRKRLICGNHDRVSPAFWYESDAKRARSIEKFAPLYRDVFSEVSTEFGNDIVRGHAVLLSHFPYEGDSTEKERFIEFRPSNRGQWLLHGHVHDRWKLRDKQVNVGVDAWQMVPVSESQLSAIIEAEIVASSCAPELVLFMRKYGFFDAWVLLIARNNEAAPIGHLASDLVEEIYRSDGSPEDDGINSLIADRIPRSADHFSEMAKALEANSKFSSVQSGRESQAEVPA